MKYIKLLILLLIVLIAISAVITYQHNKKINKKLNILQQHTNYSLQNSAEFQLYKMVTLLFSNQDFNTQVEFLDDLDHSTLLEGELKMKNHKAIIAGIVRDSASDMPYMIKSILEIGSAFKEYKVIIFENDSIDGTKQILSLLQYFNPNVKVISEDYGIIKRPSIKFLSDARNRYLHEIRAQEYNDFDILIVADLDMKYGMDIRGVKHSFAQEDKWDVVCSNGLLTKEGKMYDAFAYRNLGKPKEPYERAKDEIWPFIMSLQKVYLHHTELIPVSSCFGGLAIYKRKYIKDCLYDSIDEDCEHVDFHQCILNNKGCIFMNPKQIIKYSNY